MPEGQFNSMNWQYGINATPDIEAGFYMDISARSIDAVESMQKYILDLGCVCAYEFFTPLSG